ncbi:MAG TPA: protein translocase subunit SecF [Candidatus Margulisiibacteriota bacterium]|nr:protein translocase subunit SecF [Candidatus Margulisiibacteriota bacterium]
MELIKPGTNFDFIRFRWIALGISWVLIAIGIFSLIIRGGPNYGIDFSGGIMLHLRFPQPQSLNDIRHALDSVNLSDATIQDFGSGGTEFLVRLPVTSSETKGITDTVTQALQQQFGKDHFEVLRVELVGPRVGSELRQRALLAVMFSTVLMAAYIWFRFEFRFGIGAAVALVHDVLVAIGALSVFNYEIDLTVVAALLTVVGFSVHDTVIVCDRIRENMRKGRRESIGNIINRSINETLSRTVLTTGTAILVVLSLFILGGNVIRGFAFTLLVGFIIGTYSSIYIASPIVLWMERAPARR